MCVVCVPEIIFNFLTQISESVEELNRMEEKIKKDNDEQEKIVIEESNVKKSEDDGLADVLEGVVNQRSEGTD